MRSWQLQLATERPGSLEWCAHALHCWSIAACHALLGPCMGDEHCIAYASAAPSGFTQKHAKRALDKLGSSMLFHTRHSSLLCVRADGDAGSFKVCSVSLACPWGRCWVHCWAWAAWQGLQARDRAAPMYSIWPWSSASSACCWPSSSSARWASLLTHRFYEQLHTRKQAHALHGEPAYSSQHA